MKAHRQCALGIRLLLLGFAVAFAAPLLAQPAPLATAEQHAVDASRDQLRNEIADLQRLLDGELPAHNELAALFEIDLDDSAAVAQRAATLRQRLADLPPAPAAAVTADDAKPAADATADAGGGDDDALRIERDRLRLAFLSLPADRRQALLEADRLRRQQQSAAAEQQASAAALAATEQARNQALAAASNATSDAQRAFATQQARLLAYASELTTLRQTWAQTQQSQLAQRRELLERYAAVIDATPLAPARADALYSSIRTDLAQLRIAADDALNALNAPSDVAPLPDDLGSVGLDAADADKLRALHARLDGERADMGQREAQQRYETADALMDTLSTLQKRRVALLPMLSPAKRAEVTGFTRDGFERLVSEVDHLRLMARWYPIQRLHRVRSLAGLLHNLFDAGRVGVEFTTLIILLGGLWFVRRRSRPWLRRAQHWLSAHVQPRTLMLRVDNLMQMLVAVAQELVVLCGVYLVFDGLLHGAQGAAELATIRKLAYAYAFYALALAFIHRVLLTAVSRYRTVDPALNEKIRRSVRLVARLALLVSVYLIVAQVLLGRGALYGIAKDVATVGAFIVFWRLIHAWRVEITRAYLQISPTGRLAELVRLSQKRRYGLVVSVAAFAFVAARGLWTWLRDLALGFQQTRKALAYLFRRQLERQSKNQAAAPDPSLLPADLQAALTEEPAPAELSIDHYPQLAEVAAMATRLAGGGHGGLVALSGERGAGKTTWLLALQRQLGDALPLRLETLQTRVATRASACRALAELLGCDSTDDPDALIAAALQAPPQVVMIDLAQNLVLRTVGGLDGYECFVYIARATASRVLWVVSFAAAPFHFLQRVHPGREVYDRRVMLSAWSEQDIGTLINTRMQHAGYTADYDQLLLNSVALAPPGVGSNNGNAAERIADRYHRLIWDYSDGNPRVALHFFRLSLSPAGERKVTVRLFQMPSGNALEETAARTRLVLACLHHHENLTAIEAASSLRFPVDECVQTLERLQRAGFLVCEADARYRVTSHWNRAVLRFLQRKKLLAA
ncbi:hypothetical protein [Solimonas marina]|uniref:AAA+ ATPase domain-containing protein n=1 Tax=Solimonas marina TaxID=2714601 RepID=A0A969W7L7_9GAMM|nr:hypothetical protein [Solimonas marina]NKF20973.1 hypothetical protein [Solimonas marina]